MFTTNSIKTELFVVLKYSNQWYCSKSQAVLRYNRQYPELFFVLEYSNQWDCFQSLRLSYVYNR